MDFIIYPFLAKNHGLGANGLITILLFLKTEYYLPVGVTISIVVTEKVIFSCTFIPSNLKWLINR